jgi:membrane-associated protein
MNIFDANSIVANLGLLGVLAMIFAETGLLVGLVLPGGDTLLFLAGLAASSAGVAILGSAQLSAPLLFLLAPMMAIIGGEVGYWSGNKYGARFFNRPEGRVFNKANVAATEKWLRRYGPGKALILGRFVPLVRTLINPTCGIIGLSRRQFSFWNAVSGVIWTQSFMGVGFLLGDALQLSAKKYLLPLVVLIVGMSLIPVAIEILKERNSKNRREPT